jgi:hypothetical protein
MGFEEAVLEPKSVAAALELFGVEDLGKGRLPELE